MAIALGFSSHSGNQFAGADTDPYGSSLAFGLTSATLTGLFLVLSLYCILDDFDMLGEIDPTPEPVNLSEIPGT